MHTIITSNESCLADPAPSYESIMQLDTCSYVSFKHSLQETRPTKSNDSQSCGVCGSTSKLKYLLNRDKMEWFANNHKHELRNSGRLCCSCYFKWHTEVYGRRERH